MENRQSLNKRVIEAEPRPNRGFNFAQPDKNKAGPSLNRLSHYLKLFYSVFIIRIL
jgi:hypothetical protein